MRPPVLSQRFFALVQVTVDSRTLWSGRSTNPRLPSARGTVRLAGALRPVTPGGGGRGGPIEVVVNEQTCAGRRAGRLAERFVAW